MTTVEQRKAALDIGNTRRLAQAAWRRDLREKPHSECRSIVAALFRHPSTYDYMRARYALESIPRFGPSRAGKLIRRAGLGLGRLDCKIGELTERERDQIAAFLEDPERSPTPPPPTFTPDELSLIAEMANVGRRHRPELSGALGRIASKCGAA